MNSKKSSRREVIKLFVLAGFSLPFISCWDSDRKVKPFFEDAADSTSTEKVNDTVEQIEKILDSKNVVYLQRNDEKYNQLRTGFNLRVQKFPQLIALCKNTAGVVEAIQLANEKKLKVAVKSGGHSFEGFSSIQNGLQINLSLLNAATWTENHQLSVGPALSLKQLYDFMLPEKRIIPSGSCGSVGIGGITLGGGYGFFSRKYGLTCDSLKQATFVDGAGEIHQVKAGDELMWALKGGGNGNFGVVTQFQFETQPAPDSFTHYRFKVHRANKKQIKELLQLYFEHTANLPETCFAAFVLNYKTLTLLLTNFGDSDETVEEMVKVFKEKTDDVAVSNKKDLAHSLSRYYGIQHPIYFKNASAGLYKDYHSIASSIDDVLEVLFRKRGLIYQINTLGGNINNPTFEKESCYPHRALPYLSELQSYWEEDENPTDLMERFDEIQHIFYKNGIRAQYRNYPNLKFKNWENAYYGSNYAKLQRIKSKYDRQNIFFHRQTVKK